MKKTMEETFHLLNARLIDANYMIDESSLANLNELKGTTITIGCGGSLVVANYLSKVLMEKGIFSISKNARDILHEKQLVDNLIGFSYSGKTHGIQLALDHFTGNKYLLTCNTNMEKDNTKIISLGYENMDKEESYISISSTLIPMGELLKFHKNMSKYEFSKFLREILEEANKWAYQVNWKNNKVSNSSEVFEIFTGNDTSTTALFLESLLVEAGLGIPILHDKYSFCHGRSTLAYKNNKKHNLIYLMNEQSELDDFLLSLIKNNYNNIMIMDVSNQNMTSLEKEYYLTVKSIFFCKRLAEEKNMDLSQVGYNPYVVRKVYPYKGEI